MIKHWNEWYTIKMKEDEAFTLLKNECLYQCSGRFELTTNPTLSLVIFHKELKNWYIILKLLHNIIVFKSIQKFDNSIWKWYEIRLVQILDDESAFYEPEMQLHNQNIRKLVSPSQVVTGGFHNLLTLLGLWWYLLYSYWPEYLKS